MTLRGALIGSATRIVPDSKWPGMWRVDPDGRLSNLMDRTWAKGAASLLASAPAVPDEAAA
jgi:hypothetical protein